MWGMSKKSKILIVLKLSMTVTLLDITLLDKVVWQVVFM